MRQSKETSLPTERIERYDATLREIYDVQQELLSDVVINGAVSVPDLHLAEDALALLRQLAAGRSRLEKKI